jgi:endonuclease/exonuclease/phosphatase (EEP) superfamily protein YafD
MFAVSPLNCPSPLFRLSSDMKVTVKNSLLISSIATYIVSLALFASTFLGQFHWFIDIWSHFIVQVSIVGLLSALVIYILSRRPIAFLLFLPVISILVIYGPYSFFPAKNSDRSLGEIYYINMNYFNEDTAPIINQIEDIKPKTVAVVEVNSRLVEKLSINFPNRIIHTQDAASCAIYSKEPFIGEVITDTIYPICIAEFESYTLIVVHPFPPMSDNLWEKQVEHFAEIRKLIDNSSPYLINRTGRSNIVIGDFNSTIFSPTYRYQFGKFHKISHYTWNTGSPLSIPIDHAISNSLELKIKMLQKVSSDHNGLSVEVVR